jgi:hypothetical protein
VLAAGFAFGRYSGSAFLGQVGERGQAAFTKRVGERLQFHPRPARTVDMQAGQPCGESLRVRRSGPLWSGLVHAGGYHANRAFCEAFGVVAQPGADTRERKFDEHGEGN